MQIEIVSATRLSQEQFWNRSALGQSLRRIAFDPRVRVSIAFNNMRGLPEIYNARLRARDAAEIVVFIHDDVWIDDFFFCDRIADALSVFDVVGVAGNKRLPPSHVAWCFLDLNLTWDDKHHLSGCIAQGANPFGQVSYFGASSQPCELLDGVMMALRRERLRETNVLFDEQFDFHFYDLDFCRTARANDLSIGTWPIALTHQSGGNFGSDAWQRSYRNYCEKWLQT
jgi:hypothetical protein